MSFISMLKQLPIGSALNEDDYLPNSAKWQMKTSDTADGNMPAHISSESAENGHGLPSTEHEAEHSKFAPPHEEIEPAWNTPLSKAFSAISGLMRGQSEDFLPPPDMQGIIPRPQLIPYQPIPYQAPILRRY